MKKTSPLLIITAVLVIFVFIYNMFFKSDSLLLEDSLTTSAIGEELLRISSELERINFDTSILSSPGFTALTDFSIEIPQQPTGRSNPFQVIGRD